MNSERVSKDREHEKVVIRRFVQQYSGIQKLDYKVVELPANLGPTWNLNNFATLPWSQQCAGSLDVVETHIAQVRPSPANSFPNDSPHQPDGLRRQAVCIETKPLCPGVARR